MPLTLRQIQAGSADAIPNVFLHGFMGSSDDWTLLNYPEGLPVYALDLPGHGLSADDSPTQYDFETLAQTIYKCVYSAFSERVNLVGYSMGGRIALSVAHFYPALVESVILESASPGISDIQSRAARLEQDRIRSEKLFSDPEEFISSWFENPLFDSLRNYPDTREQLIANRINGPWKGWSKAIMAFSQGVQPDFAPWLSTYDGRIGVISGALDLKYTTIAASLNRKNRRIRHITVAGAGHNVHVEQPELYLTALLSLLGS